jgi:hypothetical protein
MQFRYMGFDQQQNTRIYRFQGLMKGEPVRNLVITVDVGLFRMHRIHMQDGPMLCAAKLASDLENPQIGSHELNDQDFRTHATARATAEIQKADARRRFRATPS